MGAESAGTSRGGKDREGKNSVCPATEYILPLIPRYAADGMLMDVSK